MIGYEVPNPPGSCPMVTVPEPIARSGEPAVVVPSTPWSVRPHVTGEDAGKGEIACPAGTGPSDAPSGTDVAPFRTEAPDCCASAAWAVAIRPWMSLISPWSRRPFDLTCERRRSLWLRAADSPLTRD